MITREIDVFLSLNTRVWPIYDIFKLKMVILPTLQSNRKGVIFNTGKLNKLFIF
jgi:hypothetical protein